MYRTYELSLGNPPEKDFSRNTKLATECLITIDDILNEMAMVENVFRDQARAIVKAGLSKDRDRDGSSAYVTQHSGAEGMRSMENTDVVARLKHMQKDATMLRESVSLNTIMSGIEAFSRLESKHERWRRSVPHTRIAHL